MMSEAPKAPPRHMGSPGRAARGEELLSSSLCPGSRAPHPVWLCLCGTAAMGETRVSPKTLQNAKQLSAACVGRPCRQQLAVPHTIPWLPAKGQCATRIPVGHSVPAQAGGAAGRASLHAGHAALGHPYGSHLSPHHLLLSHTQPPVSSLLFPHTLQK